MIFSEHETHPKHGMTLFPTERAEKIPRRPKKESRRKKEKKQRKRKKQIEFDGD